MIRKILLLGIALFFSDFALANPCFNSLKQGSAACTSYSYDTLSIYFKDSNNKEQQFIAKRVRDKKTGRLLHVDYDFIISCSVACGNVKDVTTSALWDWRTAYLNNKFYQKVPYVCDPTVEKCCNTTGCNQIYSDPVTDQLNAIQSQTIAQANQGTMASTTPKKGSMIDKPLQRTESVTNIADNIIRNSQNGPELQTEVAKVSVQAPLFYMRISTSGGSSLCMVSGADCIEISGYVTQSDSMADVSVRHNYGQDTNRHIERFLENYFIDNKQLICYKSSAGCGDDASSCSVVMTCKKQ
jgi:hypothetical protein